jgi:hypothetical protein
VSRARLERTNGKTRLRSGPRAIVVFEHELVVLRRGLEALVRVEGRSKTMDDLAAMLADPPPADVFRELEVEPPRCARGLQIATRDVDDEQRVA